MWREETCTRFLSVSRVLLVALKIASRFLCWKEFRNSRPSSSSDSRSNLFLKRLLAPGRESSSESKPRMLHTRSVKSAKLGTNERVDYHDYAIRTMKWSQWIRWYTDEMKIEYARKMAWIIASVVNKGTRWRVTAPYLLAEYRLDLDDLAVVGGVGVLELLGLLSSSCDTSSGKYWTRYTPLISNPKREQMSRKWN